MGYKETPAEDEASLGIAADLSLGDDELSFEQEAEESEFTAEEEVDATLLDADEIISNKKSKAQAKRETFSLQARRAIEDYVEQRRLREELDYLYDDGFANPDDTKK